MKINIECVICGMDTKVDVVEIIGTIIECAERDSIYGGFICSDCNNEQDHESMFKD
ncbi:MAG TPA: hypothetical protein PKN87_08705 [Syntrophomonadaceae bacterium]|nr:hypothetical protein [Syntrophomonadaceae bacterium]HPR93793.1 hypothetical protein [Syntrophomonadaceae bacterium]